MMEEGFNVFFCFREVMQVEVVSVCVVLTLWWLIPHYRAPLSPAPLELQFAQGLPVPSTPHAAAVNFEVPIIFFCLAFRFFSFFKSCQKLHIVKVCE